MSLPESLIYPQQATSHRESSWDRTGGNYDAFPIAAGETKTILNVSGSGAIRHIWCTIACEAPFHPRKILLRMYWDDETTPSVDCPIGDFFGACFGVYRHYWSAPLNVVTTRNVTETKGAMNSFFVMPFTKNARVEIVNESETEIRSFYFYIDYQLDVTYDRQPLMFHAKWRRENPTDGTLDAKAIARERAALGEDAFYGSNKYYAPLKNLSAEGNYVILDAEGSGHYVGCNLSVDNIDPVPGNPWFGEGDDMILIDGEPWPPRMHGTGTEDYFCAAWGYPSGPYSMPYHGVILGDTIVPHDNKDYMGMYGSAYEYNGKWVTYRFHLEDPVIFKKSVKVTIEHGHANAHSNDMASTAYWYQTEPHKPFEPMLPVEQRIPLSNEQSITEYMKRI